MLHNYVSRASLHQPAITILSHGPLHTLHLCTACTYLVIATHYIFSLGQVTEALTQQTSNLGTTSFSFPQLRSNDPKPKTPFTGESSEEFEKRITQQLLQLWKYLIKIITMLLWRVYLCTQHFQVYWNNLYFTPGDPYPSHSLQVLSKGICNLAHCTKYSICKTKTWGRSFKSQSHLWCCSRP